MRPDIPDDLAERAEDVLDVGGYNSVGELIRDAVRRRVEGLERASGQEARTRPAGGRIEFEASRTSIEEGGEDE